MKKCLLNLLLLFISPVLFAQTVFINEIHYDNTGTDVNEAIEIAGSASTNLSGWKIVLYNGSDSKAYGTINLTGIITDQQAGFGAISFAYAGIQNGSPDGIALINGSGTVVQFLSYEGVFTAADGPAIGVLSTDIGISEPGTGAVNFSLQLKGAGSAYNDFTWQNTISTFGSINTDQFFGTPSIPLLINEFVLNHIGDDTYEYVEFLSNPNTNLKEYFLLEIDGHGSTAGTINQAIQLGTSNADGYYTTPFSSEKFGN